uniref:Uncharacterized protein n=1 Tax=Anguilla anguilla TaxID=7936 RepID=A0A0E9QR99_ANGAN
MLHRREGQVMSVSWFPPDVERLALCTKELKSWFHQARESCFSWSERPLGALWQTPSGLSCAIYFFTVWAL